MANAEENTITARNNLWKTSFGSGNRLSVSLTAKLSQIWDELRWKGLWKSCELTWRRSWEPAACMTKSASPKTETSLLASVTKQLAALSGSHEPRPDRPRSHRCVLSVSSLTYNEIKDPTEPNPPRKKAPFSQTSAHDLYQAAQHALNPWSHGTVFQKASVDFEKQCALSIVQDLHDLQNFCRLSTAKISEFEPFNTETLYFMHWKCTWALI